MKWLAPIPVVILVAAIFLRPPAAEPVRRPDPVAPKPVVPAPPRPVSEAIKMAAEPRAADLPAEPVPTPVKRVDPAEENARRDDDVRFKVKSTLVTVQLKNAYLQEVAAILGEKMGIAVIVDPEAAQVKVDMDCAGISVESMFAFVLEMSGLEWIPLNGQVLLRKKKE